MKLFCNGDVYAPAHLGRKDVLIEGTTILRIADHITGYENNPDCKIYDCSGMKLVPGYIDVHEHLTGGGGEQGPASRVPEAMLSQIVSCGVTTVVGLLGTDGITRSLENLIAKARALQEEGLTVFALTGSYGWPSVTITGSIEKDIVLIPPFIGVKIAVSDHRSSDPDAAVLIQAGTDARRAGLLSGTAGYVTMHMGSGKAGLHPLFEALADSDIPISTFLPTHVLRTPELMEQSAELIRMGGYVDATAGSDSEKVKTSAEKLFSLLNKEGVSADHVTLSSDAFGSQPKFDETGNCIGLTFSTPEWLHETIRLLVEKGMPLEEALKLLTSTPAHVLKLDHKKGSIETGADADLILLDNNFNIDSVFAMGKEAVIHKTVLMKGRFEA